MLVALTDIAVLTNDTSLARLVLEQLMPHVGYQLVFTTVCVFGPAEFFIGLLKQVLGETDADSSIARAEKQCLSISHQPVMSRIGSLEN